MLIEWLESGPVGTLPLALDLDEAIGRVPQYRVEFQCDSPVFDHRALLGQQVGVSLQLENGERRAINAVVTGGGDCGRRGEHFVHYMNMSSWMATMAWRRNSRIFQDLDVVEILRKVFADHPTSRFDFRLENRYPARSYTVQYEESDLHFVSRLLEEEGIIHYPEHEDAGLVVFADGEYAQALDAGGPRLVEFIPDSEELRSIVDRTGIQRLDRAFRLQHNKVVLRDYDYHHPSRLLQVQTPEDDTGYPMVEHYDYSANYRDIARGEQLARVRQLIARSQRMALCGEANLRWLTVAQHIVLFGHPDGGRNRGYTITRTMLRARQDEPDSQSGKGDLVELHFECLPDDVAFKSEQLHAKPRALGTQSATVVGPQGVEIHTDSLARIRVHFHWDRYTREEHDASCWMRVVQMWNGKGWGVIAMPRVGNEVMVNFVDGDIDRPLVIGQVYNGALPPPYKLPEDIRYSGMVSRSLRYGEPRHASQITIDDTRNRERLIIHGERDVQDVVERNRIEYVENDSYELVENTKTRSIENQVEKIKSSESNTKISISVTGLSVSYTGVSTSLTRCSTSTTGLSTSFTGVSTSFTGISNSLTGISSSITGIRNRMTGVSNSATGVSSSVTGIGSSITGVSSSVTGVSNSTTGVSTRTTGSSVSATGVSTSVTGVSTRTTGSSVRSTGVSTSVTGVSTSTTGSSVSATGMSISMTGVSSSSTGVSVSSTGVSISFTGASKSKVGINIKG